MTELGQKCKKLMMTDNGSQVPSDCKSSFDLWPSEALVNIRN